jgi:hypothetical protein
MAQPWKHPSTGFYYLRREIPTKLRPAFEGKAMWKVSLRTRDFSRAAVLFAGANAELEQRFEEARKRFAESGDPRPSKRDHAVELVSSYFEGPPLDEGGLDGPERLLLCRLEVDRGLWNATPGGCSQVNISDDEEWWRLSGNAALFRGHRGTLRHLTDRAPGEIWRYPDHRFSTGARDIEIKRILTQVARHHGRAIDDLPDGTAEYISEYLDRLPVGPSQARKPQSAQSRLKPEMRLLELFEAWKEDTAPKAQTAHEYERAALDFIDFVGDIPVSEIVKNDLLNYRDEALKLPKSMPRKDRELPFTERVAKHASVTDGRVSAPTLKKKGRRRPSVAKPCRRATLDQEQRGTRRSDQRVFQEYPQAPPFRGGRTKAASVQHPLSGTRKLAHEKPCQRPDALLAVPDSPHHWRPIGRGRPSGPRRREDQRERDIH